MPERRDAEGRAELGELRIEDVDGVPVQCRKGRLGDVGSHERVAISVATDPCAEREQGESPGIELRLVETCLLPCVSQVGVEAWNHAREDGRQVVENIAEFIGDFRTLEEDVPRPPQALEECLRTLSELRTLERCPHLVLAQDEDQVELAVLLEDGGSLGLGRMRREHRFHVDVRTGLGDVGSTESRVVQIGEHPPPRSGLGCEA